MIEKRIEKILVLLGLVFMLFFCLVPFLYMMVISLRGNPDITSIFSSSSWTLDNYHAIFHVPTLHFVDYLKNSLIVSFISSFLCVWIAALSAYALTRFDLPGKLAVLFTILCISMFPQISLIGYLFKLFSSFGWINTYQGLIFPYIAWSLPLSVWLLVSYFSQIPRDLDMAARIDGGSHWQILRHIIIPVALPGLFSCGILTFIFSFNEFIFALMLTTDYHARTIPIGITLFQGLHGQIPWGHIMAASSIATFPVVLLVIFFQRHIVRDLTRGAVMG